MAALTTVAELRDAGLIEPDRVPVLEEVAATFRIRVTDAMRSALRLPDDPIGRQFLPSAAELAPDPVGLADPIGDRFHAPVPGLTHRYPDRAILHVTQTCAVYCRFCFRRETVGAAGPLPEADLAAALAYVAATPGIREVILTGGDPLTLSPRRLARLLARLDAIPHVEVLRHHTRIPVVAPEAITPALVSALSTRATPWVVLHVNHAQELTPAATEAIARLTRAGLPLLSQTVLLKGVNDDADALEDLFRALVRNRVKPYYLHHCDLARGAAHFRTTIPEGQALMATLRGRLSGPCLPTYVLDIPGGHGKVPIGPDYLVPAPGKDVWHVTDPQGTGHSYSDPGGSEPGVSQAAGSATPSDRG